MREVPTRLLNTVFLWAAVRRKIESDWFCKVFSAGPSPWLAAVRGHHGRLQFALVHQALCILAHPVSLSVSPPCLPLRW
jgi:hypothetical protein